MKYRTHKKKKGFSLIEILFALFVLTVGIVATITLVTQSIREVAGSRDSIVAASLAQEGAELARNIRDNNASAVFHQTRQGGAVTASVFDYFAAGECRIEPYLGGSGVSIWLRCDGGTITQNQSRLRQELTISGQYFYRHRGSGGFSDYRRKIIIDNVQLSEGEITSLDVTSMATWGNTTVPSDINSCTSSTNCVFDKTTLTSWLIHE